MITRITIEFESQNEAEADELAKQLVADAETALIEARVVRIYPPKIETFSERHGSLASFNAWQQAQAAERQADEMKGRY